MWFTTGSDNAYFVDLFVRPSNVAAVEMYKKMGYHIHKVIPNYYTSSLPSPSSIAPAANESFLACCWKEGKRNYEDGYDMRKYKK